MNPPGVRYCRWSDITNLVNQKRIFTIECQRTDDSAQFVFSEQDLAKYVWKTCVAQHSFFKGQTVPVALVERVNAQAQLQLQAQQNAAVDSNSASVSSSNSSFTGMDSKHDDGESKRFDVHSSTSPSRTCVVQKNCSAAGGNGNVRLSPGDAVMRCQLYDEQVNDQLPSETQTFTLLF